MEHTIVAGDSKRSVVNMLVARSDCDVWPPENIPLGTLGSI